MPELFKRRNVLIRPVPFPFPDHQHLFVCDPNHSTRSLQAVSATELITAFSIHHAPDTWIGIRGNWVTRILFMPCIAEGSNCVLQQSAVFLDRSVGKQCRDFPSLFAVTFGTTASLQMATERRLLNCWSRPPHSCYRNHLFMIGLNRRVLAWVI